MRICKNCRATEGCVAWVTRHGMPNGRLCLACKGIKNNTAARARLATEEGREKNRLATRAYLATTAGKLKSYAATKAYRSTAHGQEVNKSAKKAYVATSAGRARVNKVSLAWAKNNPSKVNAMGARRRIAKLHRTPAWVDSEHTLQIESMYNLAKIMEGCTGKKYHVDHIVPLRGKEVSGLHVCYNLQVIESSINLAKGNSYGG